MSYSAREGLKQYLLCYCLKKNIHKYCSSFSTDRSKAASLFEFSISPWFVGDFIFDVLFVIACSTPLLVVMSRDD